MSHLNLYLPDPLAREMRSLARRKGKSLSALIVEKLTRKDDSVTHRGWPKNFFKTVAGAWSGPFPEPERPLPEENDL